MALLSGHKETSRTCTQPLLKVDTIVTAALGVPAEASSCCEGLAEVFTDMPVTAPGLDRRSSSAAGGGGIVPDTSNTYM